jgi:hypothetical protein
MEDYKNLTQDEFLKLSPEKIKEIIKSEGKPKVGVLLPDGTRRAAIIWLGYNPDDEDFADNCIDVELDLFMKNIEIIFNYGLNTLIIPILNHDNFSRGKKFVKNTIYPVLSQFLTSNKWMDFYKKHDIKVKVYGDIEYAIKEGHKDIGDFVNYIQEQTAGHKTHKIFWGIAASNSNEHRRLMDLGINFYKLHGRYPTPKEKIELYYGEPIDYVDFLIRAAALRDSDLTPPIITGKKTHYYFLVISNLISFTPEVYKSILYDLIICREKIRGKKIYSKEDIEGLDLDLLKDYYEMNKHSVIGLGLNVGDFWLPINQIKIPPSLKKFQDKN